MNAATGLTGGIIIQNAIDKQRIEKLYEEKQKIMESIINDFKTKLLEMIEKNKEHLSTKEFNELKAILDQATTSSKQWLEKSYFGLLLMFAIIFPFYIKNYGPPKSDSMVDFWRTSAHLWTSVFAWLTSSFIKNSDYITAMPIISLIFYWYTTAIIQTLEKNNPTMHPGHPLLENWMRMKCILIGIANGISQYFVYHKKLSGPNHTQNRALLAQTGNVFSRVAAQVAKKDYT
jgi:hypothetical protein